MGNAASVNVCLSLYTSCKVCARNGRGRDIAPLRRERVRPEMLGHRTRDIGSHTSHNPNNAHVAAGSLQSTNLPTLQRWEYINEPIHAAERTESLST